MQSVAVVGITLALWVVVQDDHKLQETVRAWRDAEPYTTFLGKMQELLNRYCF